MPVVVPVISVPRLAVKNIPLPKKNRGKRGRCEDRQDMLEMVGRVRG